MRFFKIVLASALGYILAAALVITIIISIIFSVASSSKPDHSISEQSVLNIKLNYPIVDRVANDEWMFTGALLDPNMAQPVGLNNILRCIEVAKDDENIKGIVLDLTAVQAGYAKLSEIREKIEEFKESGKFVYAYADYYYVPTYYLASVADSIFINPEGEMIFNGMVAEITFFSNTLKKLGIEMQVIRHGKYKGAVEPFVRQSLSDNNKQQIQEYINSVYGSVLSTISTSRNILVDELKNDANGLQMRSSDDFIAKHYLDGKRYRDQFYTNMKLKMGLEESSKVELVSLNKYVKTLPRPESAKDRIAVVYASGDIVGGNANGNQIGAEDLAKTLKKIRESKKIKAVVLRIDSRGGSSLASDIIWREVKLLVQEKPVIVSMGDVAASGGYYIAAPATKIVAEPTTITGSIGVFGLIPNAQKFLNDKLGVNLEYVGTGEYSDIGRVDRALKPEEKAYIEEIVNRIYDQFLNRVSEGRNMTTAQVDSIGQGRVWTGVMAKKIGLVDELGGLEYAIHLAATEANLSEYKLKEYPILKDPFDMIIKRFQSQTSLQTQLEESGLGTYFKTLMDAQQWGSQHSVQMMMPYDVKVKNYFLR